MTEQSTIEEIVAFLKLRFQPQGTAAVASFGWKCSGMRDAYYSTEFVNSCVDELGKVIVRHFAGEPPNPLERLAMDLIFESAYFKNPAELARAMASQKEYDSRKNNND